MRARGRGSIRIAAAARARWRTRTPSCSRDYPLNEKNLDWWASDKDSPYTEVKRFDWYRGYHVGGRSLTWGRQSYRWSDFDFEANAREASRSTGRSGMPTSRRGTTTSSVTPASPDRAKGSRSCPTASFCRRCRSTAAKMQLPSGSRRVRRAAPNHPGRTANLTQALHGRGACRYRNACWLGCPFGAYFSSQSSTLPAAMATGRLTLKPFAIVTELAFDRDRGRVTGARVLDAVSGTTTEYSARHCLSLRVDAELDVAADAIRDRCVARRAGQQFGCVGPQPDGPPFPLRRQRALRRARRSLHLRPPPHRFLHSALPQSVSATHASTCAALAIKAAPAARDGSERSPNSASARR